MWPSWRRAIQHDDATTTTSTTTTSNSNSNSNNSNNNNNSNSNNISGDQGDSGGWTRARGGEKSLMRLSAVREDLLVPAQIKDTVEALLYRLVLKPSPVGGLALSLDIRLMPNLFDP